MLGGYKQRKLYFLKDFCLSSLLKLNEQFSPLKTLTPTLLKRISQRLNSIFEIEPLNLKMSTTRRQKRRNNQQESTENVSEGLVSAIELENACQLDQDVCFAGPTSAKSPRVENNFLENLRTSVKEEITSEIKNLIIESQKEMLKLLRPKTGENL